MASVAGRTGLELSRIVGQLLAVDIDWLVPVQAEERGHGLAGDLWSEDTRLHIQPVEPRAALQDDGVL
jgi:hypothetical protein